MRFSTCFRKTGVLTPIKIWQKNTPRFSIFCLSPIARLELCSLERNQSKPILRKNEFLTSLACVVITRIAILPIWSGNLRSISGSYVYCLHFDAVSRIAWKTSEMFCMCTRAWACSHVVVFARPTIATREQFILIIAFHFAILYYKIPRYQLVVNVFYFPCDHNSGIAFCFSSNVQGNVRSW